MVLRTLRGASLLALLLLVAACGGTAAPTGSVAAPTSPAASFALPSGALPSFAMPSSRSFAPDLELEALFPDQIDGQPVTSISSASFLAILQAFESEEETVSGFISGMQSIGVDPARVAFASGIATLDDDTVQLQALRTPGGSAAAAIDVLTRLDPDDETPTLTTETIGGKSATVATDSDGDEEYFYVNGDVAWFLSDADRAQAATIFAALP